MHPKDGPSNGITTKNAVGIGRSTGFHISAILPSPTSRQGLPMRPAKNLVIQSETIVLENPAPIVKSTNKNMYGT